MTTKEKIQRIREKFADLWVLTRNQYETKEEDGYSNTFYLTAAKKGEKSAHGRHEACQVKNLPASFNEELLDLFLDGAEEITPKLYNHQLKLSKKKLRGGARPGCGRKRTGRKTFYDSIGIKKESKKMAVEIEKKLKKGSVPKLVMHLIKEKHLQLYPPRNNEKVT